MAEANPGTVSKKDMAHLKMRLVYHERIVKAVEEGTPFALQTLSLPPEPFEALGIPLVHIGDYLVSMIEMQRYDGITEAIDMADNIWYPSTGCVYLKIPIGAVVAGQIPTPSVIVGGSFPCQQFVAGWEIIEEVLKAPIYHFEAPTWNDERALDFLGGEMKRMISFLEEHTGRKMDVDRLKEVAEESNKANEMYLEICEMRKAVPCPLPSNFLPPALFYLGMPETTTLCREALADATERVKRGESAVPEERLRMLWYDLGIFFFPIYQWLEKEWGTVVVMDLTSYVPEIYIDTSSYESMLKGLGKKLLFGEAMMRVNHGLSTRFIDEFVRVYEDYKCNCAAFAGHYADKQRPALLSILREVCRERGITLLDLAYDSIDPRVVSAEHICDKISQFLNTVVLP